MIKCFWCRADVPQAAKGTAAALCSGCVQRLCGAPDIKPVAEKLTTEQKAERKQARAVKKVAKLEKLKSATRGRGRGWHLKKLFEFEGRYFSMGEEITAAEAMKIRKELAKAIPNPNPEPKRRDRKPKVKS